MTVREETQTIERLTLSPYAALSEQSFGRRTPEPEDDLRTCYQRDRDRILHCKSFRRLKQKTQVFLSPEGDHYRTRLTHTLEVSQIARTIARALRLNEDLTEAIALGHDLGHTPYGHAGERALNRLCPGGFTHYRQSLRVVDYLEKDGKGGILGGVLSGNRNMAVSMARTLLNTMPQAKRDELVVQLINKNRDKLLQKGRALAAKNGVRLQLCDVAAKKI